MARQYLIDQLKPIADGLNGGPPATPPTSRPSPAAPTWSAVIPGTDLADQYVIVGAHYDHLGSSCRTAVPATRSATAPPTTPPAWRPRSPSAAPSRQPRPAPLGDPRALGPGGGRAARLAATTPSTRSSRSPTTVAYVNFDIQGANLLPSLRNTTFAVGAETGGSASPGDRPRRGGAGQRSTPTCSARSSARAAATTSNFLGVSVPTSSSPTRPAPATTRLRTSSASSTSASSDKQIATSLAVTRELAGTDDPPPFDRGPAAGDLPGRGDVRGVVDLAATDLEPFSHSRPADDHEHPERGRRAS